MPTATEYFGITVSNIGPLTTTYTPPPECTRATTDHLVYALESSLVVGFGSPDCQIDPYGKCLPSGAAMDSIIKEYSNPKSAGQGFQPFHSPGIHCPEGWTTAGLLAHGDKTGSAYRSGVFTSTTSVNLSLPEQMGSDEWWLKVLEPSETLAWCCPSGWASLPYGYCRSSIAPALSAGYSSACYQGIAETAGVVTVHTVEGEPVSDTDGILSFLPDKTWTTETVALTEYWSDPSLVASMVVARQFPVVEMIYKAEDVKAAKNGSKEDEDDKDGKAKDDDNAASALSRVGGVASGVALMVGLLTGAGLLMPW
ncbi:hypothetical protein FPANT_13618 [Fusarium pseudoanthophilum]|uniref:Uncharacterized protein n=1 Tax=Fusarium pseudoanthophilum TaxID=48495 RepID=A0A8H5KD33_9HYPO|nr:hypothetical protein FPANT_13618 [Fusarium pseudoanthophilum]